MSDCDDSGGAGTGDPQPGHVGSGSGTSSNVSTRKRPAPSPTSGGSGASGSGATTTGASAKGGSKRSKSTASNRGLRHFSMMVCKKVEEKGTTTYNEVADELVRRVSEAKDTGKFDEKNIRRRVYDALNVLMAMDIISKDKKEITWRGLPNFTSKNEDVKSLRHEIESRQESLRQKQQVIREMLAQQVCFRNLVMRNARAGPSDEKIPLPFIVVNTHASSVIQCDMSRDRTNVMFEFNRPFEINDDNTILKKLGMDRISVSELHGMIPDDMMAYIQEHGMADSLFEDHSHHQAHPYRPIPVSSAPTRHHQQALRPPQQHPSVTTSPPTELHHPLGGQRHHNLQQHHSRQQQQQQHPPPPPVPVISARRFHHPETIPPPHTRDYYE